MSTIFNSPNTDLPLRGASAAGRSGMKAAFRRRTMQFLATAFSAGMIALPASSGDAYPVEGYWLTKGGNSIVEIAPCNDSGKRLCGKVVWVADADAGTVGAEVMKNFRLDGNRGGDKWAKGKIQLNGAKKSNAGKLAVKGDNLKVSVCKRTTTCKSQSWTRPSASMTAEAGLSAASE